MRLPPCLLQRAGLAPCHSGIPSPSWAAAPWRRSSHLEIRVSSVADGDTHPCSVEQGSSGYFVMMTARPQAVSYGLTDSPVGLAAWVLVHPGFSRWNYGNDPQQSLTKDDVLDDISLYWLTSTAVSSARLYWENVGRNPMASAVWKTGEISLPVAITVFPRTCIAPLRHGPAAPIAT